MLENRSENTWHLEQKWTLKRAPGTSKGVPFSKHFCMLFSTCFWCRFWVEHWSKMGPKGGPKCDQKWWKIDSRARVQFWSDLGSTFDRFRTNLGSIFDWFWVNWDRLLIDFDTILKTHFSPRKTAANSTSLPEIAGHSRTHHGICWNGGKLQHTAGKNKNTTKWEETLGNKNE